MRSRLRAVHAGPAGPGEIADELHSKLSDPEPSLILFFASSKLDFEGLALALAERFPDTVTMGCTTSGEIGPEGCTTGRVSALALDAPARAHAVLVPSPNELKFGGCVEAVESLFSRFGARPSELRGPEREAVMISLTDGLSGVEELLLAAVAEVAPGLPLVGASAGDDFAFRATRVAVGTQAATGAAALLLLEPRVPFAPFHLHHFSRNGDPIVVTEADPSKRLVSRLSGFPAVSFLAEHAKLDEQELRDDPLAVLARNPIVFGFTSGSFTFMRSVMSIRGNALLMGGSLEEGSLVYPMTPRDLVAVTREGVEEAIAAVPNPQGLLVFNCGGRLWEAKSRDQVAALAKAMLPIPGAGFTTYGEQFGAVQVNHTLTGLVFGGGDG